MADSSGLVDLNANHNAEIWAVATVFASLSTICLITRFVSKGMRKNLFTLDDWLLLAGYLIALAETIMMSLGPRLSKFGYHTAALNEPEVISDIKGIYTAPFFQITALCLCKLSVIILLYRIFSAIKWYKRYSWCMGVFIIIYWLATVFAAAFICFPAAHLWDPSTEGTCGNQALMDTIIPVPWVVTDFIILIAPIPVIRKLNLKKNQMRRVYAAILIGTATCIVSTIRYRTTFFKLADFSWNMVPITLWNMIEVHVTIMCASLMLSGPVLSWLGKSVFPSRGTSSNTKYPNTLPSFVHPPNLGSEMSDLGSKKGLREMPSFLTTPDDYKKHHEQKEQIPAEMV